MKRHISFGSIGQFRSIVKNIRHISQFKGHDVDGKAMYDLNAEFPTITATGTEKIHGTNASVCYSDIDGFWTQSSENIITPEHDNYGCAFQAEFNKFEWINLIQELSEEYNINLKINIISIYFEWCGTGIQKKSCVSGVEKMSIIFRHFKVSPVDPNPEITSYWLETKIRNQWIESENFLIFNVCNFPRVEVDIDFNRPDIAQNKLVQLTELVETNSGVANHFKEPDNIGEGYVWTLIDNKGNIHKFKTKGEKHTKSKVKKLKPVDEEKEQRKIDFANYATPAFRLEQAWASVFGLNNEKLQPDIKCTGKFVSAVMSDAIKEESDILAEKSLTQSEVAYNINKISRIWFMEELDRHYGL